MRILLIDDDVDCLQGLAEALAPGGYHVDVFHDAKRAVEQYRQKQYDLVITDMKMPQMTGIQVLKAIRAHCREARVIIISGFSEVETVVEALNCHAYAFLSKPVQVGELLEVIEDISLQVLKERKFLADRENLESEYRRLKEEVNRLCERMSTVGP
jgi:DNA-binding NtrC family response regulator